MRRLTIERTITIILFMLIFAMAARVPVDSDTWWHLRAGQEILTTGIPQVDAFSHTMAGQPWIDHSWGAQLIMTGLWNAFGYTGLVMFMAGLATIGMGFVWLMCDGNAYLRAFALVLGAATAAVFWSPRPQMLSFALSAAVLYVLILYQRRGVNRLWIIPVLMLVWGNLHAGFSIGLILILIVIAGEAIANVFAPQREHAVSWRGIGILFLVFAASVVAICINPYGLRMLAVPFQTISIGALQNFIQEWNSPNFHERQVLPFLALLFLTLGFAGASRKRLSWTNFLLISGTGYLAFTAGRNIALFAVAVTPILTIHANDVLAERGWVLKPRRTVSMPVALGNLAIIVLIALVAVVKVAAVVVPPTVQQTLEDSFPVAAVEALRDQSPPGRVFNSYNWGGYLTLFAPEYPVFVDGRTDLYGDAFLSDTYLQLATGAPGFDETLTEYGVNVVLVETASGLSRALADEPGWRLAYGDDQAVLYVREQPVPAPQESNRAG